MNYFKNNIIISSTILGFLVSLGAPIGFYLHDFYFGNHPSPNFILHLTHLHQNEFSTILYIGLGTNIFFTAFGFFYGFLARKLLLQNRDLILLNQSKTSLAFHLIAGIKKASILGQEGLSYLDKGLLSNQERTILIAETIKGLKTLDEKAQDLTLIWQNKKEIAFCPVDEAIQILKRVSQQHRFTMPPTLSTTDSYLFIKMHPRFIALVFETIFEWANIHEFTPASVTTMQQQCPGFLSICIEIKFNQEITSSFDGYLLIDIVQHFSGKCIINSDNIQMILPAHSNGKTLGVA